MLMRYLALYFHDKRASENACPFILKMLFHFENPPKNWGQELRGFNHYYFHNKRLPLIILLYYIVWHGI